MKIDANKLAALSKEQKLELYDKLQAKKKLVKQRRQAFIPHEGQLPVVKCNKSIRVVTAGNGFGKTALGVNTALWAVEGFNPISAAYTKCPSFGVVVLDNPLKVKEVWLKELAKWVDLDEVEQLKNGKPYVNELVFKNGSRILFMFHEQEVAVFESLEMDWVIYDEPPPRHIFIALSRGQRTKGSSPWSLLIGTPLTSAWIRIELYEPWLAGQEPDVEFFRGTTYQNKENLAEGYIEKFSRRLTEAEKKVRLEGEFFDIGGLALAHLFKDQTHIVTKRPPTDDELVVIAIDPHPSKKHVALALAVNKRTRRYQVIGELAEKMLARSFGFALLEWSRGWQIADWVCDSLGSAEYTGGEGFKSFIEVLKYDLGIPVRATTYDEKLDEEWIERIRGALEIPVEADNFGQQVPKLQVQEHCVNLMKDIKNVAWLKFKNAVPGEDNKPKLDISNKDFLACLKYALASAAGVMKDINNDGTSIARIQKSSIKLVGSGTTSVRSRYMNKKRVSRNEY